MDKRERQELAADIARRVRLLCVQDVPKSFLDQLFDSYEQWHILNARSSATDARYRFWKSHGALHIEFMLNGETVARFRFDEDRAR